MSYLLRHLAAPDTMPRRGLGPQTGPLALSAPPARLALATDSALLVGPQDRVGRAQSRAGRRAAPAAETDDEGQRPVSGLRVDAHPAIEHDRSGPAVHPAAGEQACSERTAPSLVTSSELGLAARPGPEVRRVPSG